MTLPNYAMNQLGFAEMYERLLVGALFRPFVDVLLDRARLTPGDRVLDVACGTGIVARVARERLGGSGRVVGVDLSPQMLAVAGVLEPEVDWREGDALALPVGADEQFDVVLCQQGLQFFADKAAAAQQMRRVLAPGGRCVIATWSPTEEMPCNAALQRAAERQLGAVFDQRHSFGDAKALQDLLAGAGFQDLQVETVARTVRFEDPLVFVRMNAMALVGMSRAAPTLDQEQRFALVDAIVADSRAAAAPFVDRRGLAFDMVTRLASGRT